MFIATKLPQRKKEKKERKKVATRDAWRNPVYDTAIQNKFCAEAKKRSGRVVSVFT